MALLVPLLFVSVIFGQTFVLIVVAAAYAAQLVGLLIVMPQIRRERHRATRP